VNELLRGVVPLIASHLEITMVALVLAVVISLPMGIAALNRPRFAFLTLTGVSLVQTIPALALLALMVPLLAATGWLSPFGFPPAVIALTLYALLPIVRNTVTGLRGVDPAIVEAARGMGMSPAQIMRRVQLPLAAPTIAAGIRTSAVWTVGMATLATPVGQTCLGNYMFTGLQTRNFPMLLVGVAAAAALALILDAILGVAERALGRRARGRVVTAAALLALLLLVAIGILPRLVAGTRDQVTSGSEAAAVPQTAMRVRIGGKTFTEQYILVEVLRARLASVGIAADTSQSLGSTVIFDALAHGDIDLYVDYSGTLWSNVMKRPAGTPRAQLLQELDDWLATQYHIRSLGSLGFENAYVLAVRHSMADRLRLNTLADLAQYSSKLAIGGDYEIFGRGEWAAIERAYHPHFKRMVTFDPALLYEAIKHNNVDVITAFSSDGRIVANDLVVLADPLGAAPPYDAMILLGPRLREDARVLCALGNLHISVETMRRANAIVDQDRQTPAAAATWLLRQPGIGIPDCKAPIT
jgi:osmoprotectant transport system permease protein